MGIRAPVARDEANDIPEWNVRHAISFALLPYTNSARERGYHVIAPCLAAGDGEGIRVLSLDLYR